LSRPSAGKRVGSRAIQKPKSIQTMSMRHMNPNNSYEKNTNEPKEDKLAMWVLLFLLVPIVYFAGRLVVQAFLFFAG
jgi:hypothetical protein